MQPSRTNQGPKRKSSGIETRVKALLFTDPSCPWDYSASPAFRTIEWRYRDQVDWQLNVIGLSGPGGPPSQLTRTYLANSQITFRDRFGMPFSAEPKVRRCTSARSCQAIVAAGLIQPGSQWRALRALQLLNFNSPLLLDDDAQLQAALSSVEGLEAERIVDALDSQEVQAEYRRQYEHARTAANGPTELRGKAADSPGGVRFTAPSIVFELGEQRLEVGGFHSAESYDLAIANLNPQLRRCDPAEAPLEALALYPTGLSTQEVAAIMTEGNDEVDRQAAERELVGLLVKGKVRRIAMGNDAIWLASGKG